MEKDTLHTGHVVAVDSFVLLQIYVSIENKLYMNMSRPQGDSWSMVTSSVCKQNKLYHLTTEHVFLLMCVVLRCKAQQRNKAFVGLGRCDNVQTERSIIEYANWPKLQK